jgi:glycosyltransferase involved in cell wall biosynthesis
MGSPGQSPVLMVTNALSGGGAERAAVLLANMLAAAGQRVLLVPVRAGPADLVAAQVEVEPLAKEPGSEVRGLGGAIAKFERLSLRMPSSVVHAHCELPELLAAASLSLGRTVVTEHARSPWLKWPRVGIAVRRALVIRRTRWIVPQAGMLPWRVTTQPAVIPNPVLAPASQWSAHTKSRRALQIAVVSRLVELKRCDWVLRAAAALPRGSVEVRLVGDGSARAELERLAADLGVAAEFLGQQVDPWVCALDADVLVTASSTEADPLAVAEAMAAGMPILASAIPAHIGLGLRRSQTFSTVEELAAEMSQILADRDGLGSLRPSGANWDLASDRDASSIVRQHLRIYGLTTSS